MWTVCVCTVCTVGTPLSYHGCRWKAICSCMWFSVSKWISFWRMRNEFKLQFGSWNFLSHWAHNSLRSSNAAMCKVLWARTISHWIYACVVEKRKQRMLTIRNWPCGQFPLFNGFAPVNFQLITPPSFNHEAQSSACGKRLYVSNEHLKHLHNTT